ncbi:hypothetical protein DL98DRAFT_541660 [Cadophora sp. DSE1049]|nr:hypothetical protein DL98DRAFT_541660 [Cadophora sp. DSE1049]
MMSDSVFTTITLGVLNLGDTTITHNATGTAFPEGKRDWSPGLGEDSHFLYVIGTDSVTVSVSDLTQALETQKNYQALVEATQRLEKILSRSRSLVSVSGSDLPQGLGIQKNYQVLVEATQQLEKMLFGSGGARIIASKIYPV